jgi:hypothetical protein
MKGKYKVIWKRPDKKVPIEIPDIVKVDDSCDNFEDVFLEFIEAHNKSQENINNYIRKIEEKVRDRLSDNLARWDQ